MSVSYTHLDVYKRQLLAGEPGSRTREKLRQQLREGKLDERIVELEVREKSMPAFEIITNQGVEEMDVNMKDMLPNIFGPVSYTHLDVYKRQLVLLPLMCATRRKTSSEVRDSSLLRWAVTSSARMLLTVTAWSLSLVMTRNTGIMPSWLYGVLKMAAFGEAL